MADKKIKKIVKKEEKALMKIDKEQDKKIAMGKKCMKKKGRM